MNNFEFYNAFNKENACIKFFKYYYCKKLKKCTKCAHPKLKWNKSIIGWRCCKCSKKISLKSISFMRDSNKSFSSWLEILHLICHSKKSISINEIYRKSKQTRYETVYYMVQKIRIEMGKVNSKQTKELYTEFVFSKIDRKHFNNLPLNIRMSFKKSSSRNRDKIRLIVPRFLHFGMIKHKRNLAANNCYPYIKLLNIDFENEFSKELDQMQKTPITLKWTNQIRNNIIKLLKGVYHFTSGTHLQGVLDEYSFKYNYRHCLTPKIQILMHSIIKSGW